MRRSRAREIIRAMGRSRVAVVGDIMLDRYIWGVVDRISPEAPVPVVAVLDVSVRPGGAANVAWNLASLGVKATLSGVVGKDGSAAELTRLIKEKGLSTKNLVVDPRRATTEKIRIVAHSQQVVRADIESADPMGDAVLTKLLAAVKAAVTGAKAVVISDYGKGVVTEDVMDLVRSLCGPKRVPFLIDPKEGHFSLYRGAYAVTPNKKEAGSFYNKKLRSDADLDFVGNALLRDLEAEAVLITRGEDGMTLFQGRRRPRNFPAHASEVYDVTGAGDTVISVLAAGLAAGATIHEAIELANAAAGIVIRELGTAAVRPEELEAAFS